MFKDSFTALLKHVQIKRTHVDKGGELISDLTLHAALTNDMAAALGDHIQKILNEDWDFKSCTFDDANADLMMEVWHQGSAEGADPHLSLSELSTKKYKLTKDADTKAIFLSITLRTPPISEADLVSIINLLSFEAIFALSFAQMDLPIE